MGKAKILIVEDEGTIAEYLKLILSRIGYCIVGVVATGEEAVEIVQKNSPDLVLMDIKLKGNIDGIMACEEIKKSAAIPILYITAYGDPLLSG
jgi:two-component system, response regulator PdtaR